MSRTLLLSLSLELPCPIRNASLSETDLAEIGVARYSVIVTGRVLACVESTRIGKEIVLCHLRIPKLSNDLCVFSQ